MSDRGLELTLAALRAQLAAVVWPRYEVRVIDTVRRACRATRDWTAAQLLAPATARFLRAWNRQGCDVYFRPQAGAGNAGYLLLDFDDGPCPLAALRAAHHTPCLVVETSPARQQAWLHVSAETVSPHWATTAARHLAALYGADPASAEWRHLGRLAGFTNRKPARRQSNGLPPWVRVVWRCPRALAAIEDIMAEPLPKPSPHTLARQPPPIAELAAPCAPALYQQVLAAVRILEQFPAPDWSIVDYRVARWLLQHDLGVERVMEALRQGSPGFPRSHGDPEDYLQRTVRAAARRVD